MTGKSRQRKAKFKQRTHKRKGRRNPQVDAYRQEAVPQAEDVVTHITEMTVSSTVQETQNITKNPKLFFELQRIGIISGIIFVILTLLVIFLD